ncbi:MAG: prolipoprotein diacylglyceryl transferase [Calditrichaeota bacterium]|nr:MAG: prolipoprotein diacylglyceryl transferase [Calditrichota bacterium]MBL1205565.1 prolipoprotein diacylglyceryl transferase [Calditrichota bacterium]NOG45394.1 prolipoprotein diacylglyceryl transferase [Calditrichota bacterium]
MIEWTFDREIYSIGFVTIRYYSLFFVISFLLGIVIMKRIFVAENKPHTDVDDLLVYTMVGTVLGARLGHVLFYNPGFYFSNPIEILKVWEGGLASHGAAIGILLALHYFIKHKKIYNYLWLVDRVVITVALAAFFIRTGNLFNSEIIGKATTVPWAFKFSRYVDNVPRHPTQIYEALAYIILFVVLAKIYSAKKEKSPPGLLLGLFLVGNFGFRIFVEFFKKNQEAFEAGMILNMGQILSVPLVLLGIYMIYTSRTRPIPEPIKMPKERKQNKRKKKQD